MQTHRRLTARQTHHPQIREKHPVPEPRPQRLRASLLRGKPLGITRRPRMRPPVRPRPLHLGKYPLRKPLAELGKTRLNAPDIAKVGTEADDHEGREARPGALPLDPAM